MGSSTREVRWLLARDLASGAPGLETIKMQSDKHPDDFLYKKDRCRDRLNSATPKEGPSDSRYKAIILQCLQPECDLIRQTHFERED